MIIGSRLLLMLGLIGAAVGLFFGVKGAVTGVKATEAANRKGGDADSLFRASKLDSALDKVRAEVGDDGKLLQLTIYPGYLMVEASTGSEDDGKAFKLQSDGKITRMALTLTGPGRLEDNVFALAELDAATVGKLAGAAAGKEHATLDDVSHIVAMIDPVSGKAGLSVFLKNSRQWRASLDGSGLSNPDQDARKALDTAAKAVDTAASAAGTTTNVADELADCVDAAGTDVEKLQACSR